MMMLMCVRTTPTNSKMITNIWMKMEMEKRTRKRESKWKKPKQSTKWESSRFFFFFIAKQFYCMCWEHTLCFYSCLYITQSLMNVYIQINIVCSVCTLNTAWNTFLANARLSTNKILDPKNVYCKPNEKWKSDKQQQQ